MSTTPGKVIIDHVDTPADADPVLQLRFLQARDPRLVGRPFQARMAPGAAWLDELEPLASTAEDLRAAVTGG